MTTAPKMKTLLDGVVFGESPRWHGDRLWLADWGAKEIVAVDLDGNSEVMARVNFPSFPMSIDWLPDGRLLIVSARDGLLWRRETDGSLVTHADLSGLAEKGHPWNEIVVDGRGNAYLNNAGFEFPGGKFATGIIGLLNSDGLVILLDFSKTDPEGKGETVAIPFGSHHATCPVRALKKWLEDARVESGPLFRAVGRHGRVSEQAPFPALFGICNKSNY